MNKIYKHKKARTSLKTMILLVLAVSLLLIFFGIMLYWHFRNIYLVSVGVQAKDLAGSCSKAIENMQISNVEVYVNSVLEDTDAIHIYLLEDNENGSYEYVIDEAYSKEATYPVYKKGTEIDSEKINTCVDNVFMTGNSAKSDGVIHSIAYGEVISGYAAVNIDGIIKYVVAVDIPLNMKNIRGEVYSGCIFYCIIFAVLFAVLIFVAFIVKEVIIPIKNLEKASAELYSNQKFSFDEHFETEYNIGNFVTALEVLNEKQNRIDESLDYAHVIQSRLMPKEEELDKVFRDSYIWWQPLALVSGDLYWMKHLDEKGTIFVLGDCTGHGIPGALMSTMVISILQNIVTDANASNPKLLLELLDKQLSLAISSNRPSDDSYIKNGADIIILYIDKMKNIIFSSAGIHLFIVKPYEVETLKGERFYIGDNKGDKQRPIRNVKLKYVPGYKYYVASDGLFEQIGGPNHIPFGYSKFKKIIYDKRYENIETSVLSIENEFLRYKAGEIQRDDITLIGFRL